jgi:hypothetical protein
MLTDTKEAIRGLKTRVEPKVFTETNINSSKIVYEVTKSLMRVQIRNGEYGFLTETSTFVYTKNLKGCV